MRMNIGTGLAMALALTLSAGALQAHCGHCGVGKDGANADPGKMADDKLKWLDKELDLSPEQEAKVRAALDAKMQKVKPLHEQMEAAQKESKDAIKASLTDAQKAKFDKLMDQGHHGAMKASDGKKGDSCCPPSKK